MEPNARKLVNKLLQDDVADEWDWKPEDDLDWTPPNDTRQWPEFAKMSDGEYNDYALDLPEVWLDGLPYGVDYTRRFLISYHEDYPSLRFESDEDLDRYIAYHEAKQGMTADSEKHVYTYAQEPPVPKIPIEQKRAHAVYEYGPYVFLKLPQDPNFIRREGIDMQHCLAVAYHDYCARMAKGEIEVYSLTDTRDGLPKVDIEVALTRGSYSWDKIEKPTVTQIRGPRNELPPKDEYVEPLMAFFRDYGRGWVLTGHGVKNFDGRLDGEVFMARWRELQAGQNPS